MRLAIGSIALLVACSATPSGGSDAASDAASPDAPAACIADVIATASGGSPGNPAYSVYQCTYRGATAYYLPAQCCDQFSALVDSNCGVICAPDGGISGSGDGRCTDFDMTTCTLLWRDPRGP